MNLPGSLDVALAAWLDEAGRGGLLDASSGMSRAYKAGQSSSVVDLAAYVAARVPATFAANRRVIAALVEALPGFAPQSLLDVGAGPGVATWAAIAQWPLVQAVTLVEQDRRFVDLARHLNAGSGIAALQQSDIQMLSLHSLSEQKADLVLASYVLAELPLAQMAPAADLLWRAAGRVLVLVEPGTPQGFRRLRLIRNHLLTLGADVVAPCTHAAACPMAGDDWCHFKVRLPRSRAHMHAKGAVVPFEDEAFSYLVLAKQAVAHHWARAIAPPEVSKIGVRLRLCSKAGTAVETVARRDKASYKRAKHLRWGDLWT